MPFKLRSQGSPYRQMGSSPLLKATDPKDKKVVKTNKGNNETEIPEKNKTNVIIETRKLSEKFRNLDTSKMTPSQLKTYNSMLKNKNLTINTP